MYFLFCDTLHMYKSRPAGKLKGRTAHKELPTNPLDLDGKSRNKNSWPIEPPDPDDPLDDPSANHDAAEPSLFEKFVQIVTNANRVKKRLNEDKQNRREDPDHNESVSSDKEDDVVPDQLMFDHMAESLWSDMRENNLPFEPPLEPHIPTRSNEPVAARPTNRDNIDWTAVMTAAHMQARQAESDPMQVGPSDLSKLGHIFKLDSVKPEYTMNTRAIPDLILQMAYLKLFIPPSLLTTTALDRIQFNDSLKFHKILFGNGAGKHSLDTSLFPAELSLSESEFWQAY